MGPELQVLETPLPGASDGVYHTTTPRVVSSGRHGHWWYLLISTLRFQFWNLASIHTTIRYVDTNPGVGNPTRIHKIGEPPQTRLGGGNVCRGIFQEVW